MNRNSLYQKELIELRRAGLPVNNFDLKVEVRPKGFHFILLIEERYYSNLLKHRLEKFGYVRSNRVANKSVNLSVNDIIKAQSQGKFLKNFKKSVTLVIFERFLSIDKSGNN